LRLIKTAKIFVSNDQRRPENQSAVPASPLILKRRNAVVDALQKIVDLLRRHIIDELQQHRIVVILHGSQKAELMITFVGLIDSELSRQWALVSHRVMLLFEAVQRRIHHDVLQW
jgi:type III secretory pathway lipoprotein EscJ